MDRQKREIRQLKRDIKRAGGRRARHQLKRGLAEHPDEAHDARPDFGRHRSAELNGLDRDATRKRPGGEEEEEEDEGGGRRGEAP